MTQTDSEKLHERARKRRELRSVDRPLDAISVPQQRVLLALARYRYLTVAQFIALGVAKNESHIRSDVLPRLCRRPTDNLIAFHDFAPESAKGRIPRVYTLTKHGAELVADMDRLEVADIRYPVGGIQYANDFDHRAAYIDACIAFDAWVAADERRECLETRHYFDKIGANRAGSNRLRSVCRVDLPHHRFIVPDGLAFFDTGTKKRAVALELHRFPDVGRIVKKLVNHIPALDMDAYPRAFGHEAAGRVLNIFCDAKAAVRVMDRLLDVPGFRGSRAFQLMAFNSLDSVKADFGGDWVLADRTKANVFE
ncbi:MAG: hypothetical protein Q7R40_06385 [Phaeospirillum sp.]|nr:hypothetical protein [Phaeospirillum sp.]